MGPCSICMRPTAASGPPETFWGLPFHRSKAPHLSVVSGCCLHTVLMKFAIYADLDVGQPVKDELATFTASFRPEDDEVCVWIDEDRSNILRVSFDTDIDIDNDAHADNLEAAIQASIAELKRSVATMALVARPISVTASTDEAQATWAE